MDAVDEEVVEEDEFSAFGPFPADLDEWSFLFEFAGGRDKDLERGGRGEGIVRE